MKEKLKKIFSDEFLDKLSKDDILDMSAALSYYTALSLAPLLILAITFVAFLGEDFKSELVQQVQQVVGSNAADAIQMIAKNADQREKLRGLAGIAGLLTLLVSAAATFGQLRLSLTKIFDRGIDKQQPAAPEGFWANAKVLLKEKLFSMGMVLTFVFISIVSLVISSFLTVVFQGTALVIGQIINFAVSILIFTLLFSAIYYFLPQKRLTRRMTFVAGLITSILFSIGKLGIGLYLGQSAIASAYGAAGSMILLLMWVYFSSAIIFLSAEISHQVEKVFIHEKNPKFS